MNFASCYLGTTHSLACYCEWFAKQATFYSKTFLARLCEQAERYDEMVTYMKVCCIRYIYTRLGLTSCFRRSPRYIDLVIDKLVNSRLTSMHSSEVS